MGERRISNLRQPLSGHYYFTLKDAGAQLRAVLFRGNHKHLRFKPQEGTQILCRGRITVFEPRGEYQLVVDYLEPLGQGALAQAFEALKNRLQAEGLFEAARKKPLPFLPRRIAVVTSPTGAVVRDFLRLLRQRFPQMEVLIYPVKVQGAEAAGRLPGPGRPDRLPPASTSSSWPGAAGRLEDLWPFNEEKVARAIDHSPLPVVSAVGHEVDFTIADFVADVRAATPSAVVELVAPNRAELKRHLDRLGASLAGVCQKAPGDRPASSGTGVPWAARYEPAPGGPASPGGRPERDPAPAPPAQRPPTGRACAWPAPAWCCLSPRRAWLARQRLEQTAQRLGQSFRRERKTTAATWSTAGAPEAAQPLAILAKGLRGGYAATPRDHHPGCRP